MFHCRAISTLCLGHSIKQMGSYSLIYTVLLHDKDLFFSEVKQRFNDIKGVTCLTRTYMYALVKVCLYKKAKGSQCTQWHPISFLYNVHIFGK